MKKFRPQDFSGSFKLKWQNVGQWHWIPFRNYSTHFERISAHLHYLGEHAPKPVRKKWWPVWNRFYKRYHKKL
jgi:hypothetical protein